ncbi:MAG: 1-deoxy-D-xylulose-5-phosphate reductoisomerase [Mariprofundaceae bacterium]|nr:1-deoxy-D-xylulose-5-phosphate reductoisomerase [Mariprofundaceae bacterium]
MKKVTILGATGSIGLSTADVLQQHPNRFSTYALVAHRNVQGMVKLVSCLRPEIIVMTDEQAAKDLQVVLGSTAKVHTGMQAAIDVSEAPEVDIVVAAMVGAIGIPSALAAVKAGKQLALANKECLVTAGRLFMAAAKRYSATIFPVDSEHSALLQCLEGHRKDRLERIVLTASGGPFRQRDPETLKFVTPAEAIAHPNWDMGAKISIDSATMMNKALELIEARWLFDLKPDKLSAIIHPQSIVHAMAEYIDGSVLAHMGVPDMRGPIAYALSADDRLSSGIKSLDLASIANLSFEAVNEDRFPAMRMIQDVLKADDVMAVVMNAANEVANEAFRHGRIGFTAIVEVVEYVLQHHDATPANCIDAIWEQDQQARIMANTMIKQHRSIH